MTYSIRPATPRDLAEVTELLTDAHLMLNRVESQFGPQFAVAIDDDSGAVIGVAGIELYGDDGEGMGLFRSAAVRDAWRGRSVGAALTEDRLRWAEREGLASVFLLTETAAAYWPRFGFVRVARDGAPRAMQESHEWRHGCPASAVAMRLDLPRPVD